jgi:hypothetical protein
MVAGRLSTVRSPEREVHVDLECDLCEIFRRYDTASAIADA